MQLGIPRIIDSDCNDRQKKICIVGTGSIGQRHMKVLQHQKVVVFPVRAQRRLDLDAKNIQTVETWQQVKDLGVTHAIIATETSRHSNDVRDALEAGCQVLVEKPMAVDMVSALDSWNLSGQLHQYLFVGCCLRFQNALNTFRQRLSDIGKIHSVRIECQSYLPEWRPQRPYQDSYSARYSEGGVLRDLVHEIDYAGWIFGWPESLTAKVRITKQLQIESEDAVDLLWETSKGGVIAITLDYLTRPPRRLMRAYGEFGTIEWNGITQQVVVFLAGKPPEEITSTKTSDDMYFDQDMAFLDTRSETKKIDERLATGADGVRALAICDAARVSSETKTEMKVSYPIDL